jgi:hypothetical protein
MPSFLRVAPGNAALAIDPHQEQEDKRLDQLKMWR